MNDLGFDNLNLNILTFTPECAHNYNNLTEKELGLLSDKYNASYVVTEKPRELNFPMAYQNSHFKIYAISIAGR
jgi:hypothetical protein